MSQTPEEISPRDLWHLITQETPHRVVDFPRKNKEGKCIAQLAMVPLTQGEETIVQVECEKTLRKYFKENNMMQPTKDQFDMLTQNIVEHVSAVETLFKACKQTDDLKKSFFPTKEHINKYLSKGEVAVLIREYLITREMLSPTISTMSQEEMEALIDKLATGASYDPLERLTLGGVITFFVYLASQLLEQRTLNSSLTQQQEDITEII